MYVLVQANDVKDAFDSTNLVMKDTMGDYTIPSIAESPIMDVFPYFEGEIEKIAKFNAAKATHVLEKETEVIEEELV